MRWIVGFGRFWYDFVVGDAWEIAAGIVVVLAIGALLARAGTLTEGELTLLVGIGVVLVVGASLFLEARRRRQG